MACMVGEENCRPVCGVATWKKDILWKTMAYVEENIKIELKEIGLDIVDRPTDQPTGQPAVGSCEGGNEPA